MKREPPERPEGLPGSVGPIAPETIWIEVAKVGRPHGLRGDVRLQVYNPGSEVWQPGQRLRAWLPGRPAVLLELASFRDILPLPTATFVGVADRDLAARLTHAALFVDRDELAAADDDEFFLHDLIDARVLDAATRAEVGTVTGLLETPQDVLVIALRSGASAMIPVGADAITEMGREPGVIVVRDIDDWRDR